MKKYGLVFCIVTCVLMWLFMLSAFTYTYDTDTPAGTDAPSVIDDRIREVKDAVQERQNIDHYWPLTGSEVSDADAGKHRQVTFQAPLGADPTTVDADEGELYTKDVSANAELFWIDEGETAIQLTSAGYILGGSIKADSIGAAPIQIENNTYLKATNFAGDGEVELIAADANDDTVLPDGAELATSVAPTTDQGIANKKYVDDAITAGADPTYSGGESHTFNGGLIIKTGSKSVDVTGVVTFATAFPTACVTAFTNGTSTAVQQPMQITAKSKTAITIARGTGAGYTQTVYWIALGY